MTPLEEPSEVLRVPELTTGARRILDVASGLFYRRGIHAVGVDVIAAESGYTKRTLYDRFGSKEDLVTAYLQARHEQWWKRMERRLAEKPASPVLAFFDSYFEDAEPSGRGCAFINAAAELPEDHSGYQVIRAHKRLVRQRLGGLIRASCPTSADAVADQVFLLLEGAIAHRGVDGDDTLVTSARRAILRMLEQDRAEGLPPE
ncbi:TetR/AcrR family transcriptional regulator [Microbacterium sp. G2-8]|uniref:TetR/AcrR family transcriptional regulator n=1 Tax=Microbacterium sp. G2-8 TaxID=2842454 RepID=UPI001C8AE5B2|nr:TetR/AcrR family transcriptional regulator [Microbacterium sp. G2-8]